MKRLLGLVGVLVAANGMAGARATFGAAASGPVLATVNGESITEGELVQRLLSYYGKSSLEAMVNRTLVNQEAKRLGISATDAELDARLSLIKNQLGGAEGYSHWLTESGLTEPQHREQVRATVLTEKIVERTNPIKDADLEEAVVRVIVLSNEADARSVESVLKNGGDFIQLARERSLDRQTGADGGLLPPITRLEFPDLWKAAADLKVGQTTGPVKLGDGYAIVKLEQRRPAAQQSAQEKERNQARLLSVRLNQWLDSARRKAKITYPTPLPGQ